MSERLATNVWLSKTSKEIRERIVDSSVKHGVNRIERRIAPINQIADRNRNCFAVAQDISRLVNRERKSQHHNALILLPSTYRDIQLAVYLKTASFKHTSDLSPVHLQRVNIFPIAVPLSDVENVKKSPYQKDYFSGSNGLHYRGKPPISTYGVYDFSPKRDELVNNMHKRSSSKVFSPMDALMRAAYVMYSDRKVTQVESLLGEVVAAVQDPVLNPVFAQAAQSEFMPSNKQN